MVRKLGKRCIDIRKKWLGYGKDKEIGGDKKEAQQYPISLYLQPNLEEGPPDVETSTLPLS